MTPRDPVSSYMDTTVGGIAFNIPPTADPRLVDAVIAANERRKSARAENSDASRLRYAMGVARIVETLHQSLLVHEWAHVLQAISYPALYVRCLRELEFVFAVLRSLGMYEAETLNLPLSAPPAWVSSLKAGTTPFRVRIIQGKPYVEPADPGMLMPYDLTETDLVEDAASIFEYRAFLGQEGDATAYRAWLDEDFRYSKTFDFLCEYLPPEDAYIALPCLVLGAHMSNWPVNGLIALLALTLDFGSDLPSRLGTDDYWRVLRASVSDENAPQRVPNPVMDISDDKEHYVITREAMLQLVAGWKHHPLTPLAGRAWARQEEIDQLHHALLHPYEAFDPVGQPREWVEPYFPPLITFRLLAEGLEMGDTIGFVSPTMERYPGPGHGLTWNDFLLELLKMKAFAFGAATDIGRGSQHNCPHRQCELHAFGLCRRWTFVPAAYEECGFPEWLEITTKHRLDLDQGVLVPMSPVEEE